MVENRRKERERERVSIQRCFGPLEVAASHNFWWQCIPAVIAALGE